MYFQTVHFHLRFLSKSDLLAHFLQIKSNGEIHSKNNYYPSQQNDVIFHIFDHIKVSSVALKIRQCHLSIKITLTPPLLEVYNLKTTKRINKDTLVRIQNSQSFKNGSGTKQQNKKALNNLKMAAFYF